LSLVGAILLPTLKVVAMLLAAPLLLAIIAAARARATGLAAAPVQDVWRDWQRMFVKQRVVVEGASEIVSAAPPLMLGATLAATMLAAIGTAADAVTIVLLLAAADTIRLLALADSGGGAAARHVSDGIVRATLGLPALVALALLIGVAQADLGEVSASAVIARLLGIAAALPLVWLALDPDAAASDRASFVWSGPDLALVSIADAIRRVVVLDLFLSLARPFVALAGGTWGRTAILEGGAWVVALMLAGGALGWAAGCGAPGVAARRAMVALGASAALALLALAVLLTRQVAA
jgi:formate hydrogenlyase subunit 4